jgi:hypothetical protein
MLCRNESGTDEEVVIKWRGGMEMKEKGLIAELLASLLADDLGLPVPKPFLLEVEEGFMVGEGKPSLAAIAKGSVGLNFGSQYVRNLAEGQAYPGHASPARCRNFCLRCPGSESRSPSR